MSRFYTDQRVGARYIAGRGAARVDVWRSGVVFAADPGDRAVLVRLDPDPAFNGGKPEIRRFVARNIKTRNNGW